MSRRTTPPDLEGYRFVEFLGEGGFADVYKYEQIGRFVAVKVLHSNLGTDNQSAFEAEAHMMGKLSEHPNVVSIYGAGRTATGSAYLVMEYCPPPNLAVRIRQQHEPYAVSKALQTGIQIAGAVESAHRLKILHRDIKPANILITTYGRPALTDFGISSALGDHSAFNEGVSIPWAPPEQLDSSAPLTPAADVYALAATLWTLLAGRSPFEVRGGPNDSLALSKRIRSQPPPRVGRPDAPESLERVLQAALAKDVDGRFSSAAGFARALQAVEAELHLPQTLFEAIEVIGPGGALVPEPQQRSGTRIVGFVSIDPEPDPGEHAHTQTLGPRPSPPTHSTVPRSPDSVAAPGHDLAQTVIRPQPSPVDPDQHAARRVSDAPSDPPPPVSRAGKIVAASAAILGLLAAATLLPSVRNALGVSRPDPSESASTSPASPADPLRSDEPQPVTRLTISPSGSTYTASWNGSLGKGDSYLYRFGAPEALDGAEFRRTTKGRATTRASGIVCVEVAYVRDDGKKSEVERACTK